MHVKRNSLAFSWSDTEDIQAVLGKDLAVATISDAVVGPPSACHNLLSPYTGSKVYS